MSFGSILVVEDDAPLREVICRALRRHGYAVEEAADGIQALHVLAAEAPDMVIADILMPNMDGLELVMAIKRTDPKVRILAISGGTRLAPIDLLTIAEGLGADATLAKPFTTEELVARVVALADHPRRTAAG